MGLVGLKNAILIYLAIKERAKTGQQNRDVYINQASLLLTSIGDELKLLDELLEELRHEDLREQLNLYKAWKHEKHELLMRSQTTLEEKNEMWRREPRVGRMLFKITGNLYSAALGIEVFARPDAANNMHQFYGVSHLAQIKVPKKFNSFDDLLHSLGVQVNSLRIALARLNHGDTTDMNEVNLVLTRVAPMFSETLEQFKLILGL